MTATILFDLDGTLLDTLDDLADSMNAVLGRMGYAPHPVASYRTFVGDGVEVLARRALPPSQASDERVVQECARRMREEYGERWAVKTRPYEGIPELLRELRARSVTCAVLSNKPDRYSQATVHHFFAQGTFQVVLGAREDYPRKPDPAGAVMIAEMLGVSPRDVLYVGDTDTDMQTATRAGMKAVGALWGFRTAEELRAHGARHLCATPLELLDLLEASEAAG